MERSMTVEAASHINQLNPALPPNGDPLGEGDNHIRLIKQTLATDFPNIGGPVTLSHTTLNALVVPSTANAALSGLTPANDKVPYFNGVSTAALATLTAWGRSVIAAVDQAAARTLLGLAALAFKATVATADIDNDAVTLAKMANIATGSLIGRSTAATGDPEVITVGTGLTLSAGSLTAPAANDLQTIRQVLAGGSMALATLIPADSSLPTNTEGTLVFTQAITPQSATSKIVIEGVISCGGLSSGIDCAVALFKDGTCVAVFPFESVSTGAKNVRYDYEEVSGNTTARTYTVRVGPASGATLKLNEAGAGVTYGSKATSTMVVSERR